MLLAAAAPCSGATTAECCCSKGTRYWPLAVGPVVRGAPWTGRRPVLSLVCRRLAVAHALGCAVTAGCPAGLAQQAPVGSRQSPLCKPGSARVSQMRSSKSFKQSFASVLPSSCFLGAFCSVAAPSRLCRLGSVALHSAQPASASDARFGTAQVPRCLPQTNGCGRWSANRHNQSCLVAASMKTKRFAIPLHSAVCAVCAVAAGRQVAVVCCSYGLAGGQQPTGPWMRQGR